MVVKGSILNRGDRNPPKSSIPVVFKPNPMGRPVDRSKDVCLITDYGAAEKLESSIKRKREQKEKTEKQNS